MVAELLARLRGDSSSFDEAINRGIRGVNQFRDTAAKVSPELVGLLSGAGIVAFAGKIIANAAEIEKMSRIAGTTTDQFQRLSYAASQTETNVESLTKGLAKMQRAQVEALKGDGKKASAFADLGISLDDLKRLNPEELFLRMAAGVAGAKDQSVALTDVLSIMGKGGTEVFNMLAQGAEHLRDIMAEAPLIDPEALKQLEEAEHRMKRFWISIQSDAAGPLAFIAEGWAAILGFMGAVIDTGKEIRKFVLLGGDEFEMKERVRQRWDRWLTSMEDKPDGGVNAPKFDKDAVEGAEKKTDAEKRATAELKEQEKIHERIAQLNEESRNRDQSDAERKKELWKIVDSEQQRILNARYAAQRAEKSASEIALAIEKERLKTAEALNELGKIASKEKKDQAADEKKAKAEALKEEERAQQEAAKAAARLVDDGEQKGRVGLRHGVEFIASEQTMRGGLGRSVSMLPQSTLYSLPDIGRETNRILKEIHRAMAQGKKVADITRGDATYGIP
jgi:hypothetical protein